MDNKLRGMFLYECRRIAKYWGKAADSPEEAADGAVLLMLALLDGVCTTMPQYEMSDIDNGGMLHDDFYKGDDQ